MPHHVGTSRLFYRGAASELYLIHRVGIKVISKPWSPNSQDIEGPLQAEISWLAKMYAAFSVLALTALVTRLVGIAQLNVLGIAIPVDAFTAIAFLGVLVHWNRARWLRDLLRQVDADNSDGLQASRILKEARKSDNLFLRGFVPRVRLAPRVSSQMNVYIMEKDDPTSMVTYAAFVVILLSLLPFRLAGGHLYYSAGWPGVLLGIAALGICVLNWHIACLWLIPFSKLSTRSPLDKPRPAEVDNPRPKDVSRPRHKEKEFIDNIDSCGPGVPAFLLAIPLIAIILLFLQVARRWRGAIAFIRGNRR